MGQDLTRVEETGRTLSRPESPSASQGRPGVEPRPPRPVPGPALQGTSGASEGEGRSSRRRTYTKSDRHLQGPSWPFGSTPLTSPVTPGTLRTVPPREKVGGSVHDTTEGTTLALEVITVLRCRESLGDVGDGPGRREVRRGHLPLMVHDQ